MDARELMDVARKAGQILLTSGAEVYRVEDTIQRICASYGVECDSFVLPTGVFITLVDENRQSISLTRRIKQRTVDLHRIELVNTFSRSLMGKSVSYEEAMRILNEIEGTRHFKFFTRLAAAGLTAFVFSILFKGGIGEGTAALLISMLIYIFKEKFFRSGFFQFFEFFTGGIFAGLGGIAAVRLFPSLNLYNIIIGAIMILLPGVAITNGIKDALYGDIISSLARLGEAVYISAALGIGVGLALSAGLRWM